MSKRKRLKPPKLPSKDYRSVWRIVDGAIKKALDAHPDYLSYNGQMYRSARMSIAKRVTGDIVSFLSRRKEKNSPGDAPGC